MIDKEKSENRNIKRDNNSALIPPDKAPRKKESLKVRTERKRDETHQHDGILIETTAVTTTRKTYTRYEDVARKVRAREQAAMASSSPHAPQIATKQEEENKLIREMRAKAQELQTQIRLWESQRGQGGYDENHINSQVSELRRQLDIIPGQYWS